MRNLINGWVLSGAVLIAMVLSVVVFGLVWLTRPVPAVRSPSTAQLSVVSLPTTTPAPPTPTPDPAITATQSVPPAPSSGEIVIGTLVEINGTGGDGLRLREKPGLNENVRFVALESEVFLIKDGPQEAGDYTWWLLEAPYDSTIQGWGVANYLTPVTQDP